MFIEIIKAGKPWLGHHEVTACIADHTFDFTFIIALARTTKAILIQVMGHQFREHAGPFAFAVTKNTGNSNPGVIVQY